MKRGQDEPAHIQRPEGGKRAIISLPADNLPLRPYPDRQGNRMVIEASPDEGNT